MTENVESEYPLVFERRFEAGGERYCVEARRYPDGVGVTMTHLFEGEDAMGLCFDFAIDSVKGFAEALTALADQES